MTTDASGVASKPKVTTPGCRVWWLDPTEAPAWCDELLSESERTRAASFHHTAARQRFVAATALLKVTVAQTIGGDPFDVNVRRRCPDCQRLHGRPEIDGTDMHVSISHSGDRVAVAICAAGPVGVDVEQVNPDVDVDGMLRFVLGAGERQPFRSIAGVAARTLAFYQCWTRKESVLKATGDGLRVPMSTMTLDPPHGPAKLIEFTRYPELVAASQIHDLRPGPGYVGAVTVLSAAPVLVREFDGAAAMAYAGDLTRDQRRLAIR
jgi:4'-phosphopantetheinyl transferase